MSIAVRASKHGARMRARRGVTLLAAWLALVDFQAQAAGPRTHAEIGWRAWTQYLGEMESILPGLREFREDRQAMYAFYSGCTFPDFAQDGIHDEAAEFAHWYPFQAGHFDYVRECYPAPWDDEARKHVAFFFGVLCHGVGDTPWHFDEWGQTSFLSAAKRDGQHGLVEAAGDIFSHAHYRLRPALGGRFWWPKKEMREVFRRMGFDVSAAQMDAGCKTQVQHWRKGAVVGRLAYPYAWAAFPWTRKNLIRHPYGGVNNGAGYTASCIAHYYARLNGAAFYQNILLHRSGFPDNKPFLPCRDTVLRESAPELAEGGAPLLELAGEGGRHAVLIRFDMSDWPRETPIGKAVLALRPAVRKGERALRDWHIEAHRINRAWAEGLESAVPSASPEGQPVSGPAAHWNGPGAGSEAWAAAGCSAPGDRETEATAQLHITPGETLDRWLEWDVSDLAREWAAHPERNFGVLIQEAKAGGHAPDASFRFYSSQAVRSLRTNAGDGGGVAWHPALALLRQH